jgi:hypothetical protein
MMALAERFDLPVMMRKQYAEFTQHSCSERKGLINFPTRFNPS